MNEPHMAPWWFPANDHPLDKAIVDVRITVPKGREVVSNGKLRGRRTTRRGDDVALAGRRADGALPRVLRRRRLRRSSTGKRRRAAVARRGLRPALGRRAAGRSMRLMKTSPAVVAGLEKDLGDYPFSVVGGVTTGAQPGLRAGEPDPADLPRARLPATRASSSTSSPTSGSATTSRSQRLARHLAQRGLRDLHGVALGGDAMAAPPQPTILRSAYDDTDAGSSFWDDRGRRPRCRARSSTARSTIAAR